MVVRVCSLAIWSGSGWHDLTVVLVVRSTRHDPGLLLGNVRLFPFCVHYLDSDLTDALSSSLSGP